MRKLIAALAVTALALTGTVGQAKERKSGEEKLAELLKDRVPGEGTSCISTNRSDRLKVIDETAIVYDAGDTIWVNRTRDPKDLDWNDTLVIKRLSGSQLCKLDQITTVDQGSGFFSGVVFLEDFIPYRKANAS